MKKDRLIEHYGLEGRDMINFLDAVVTIEVLQDTPQTDLEERLKRLYDTLSPGGQQALNDYLQEKEDDER